MTSIIFTDLKNIPRKEFIALMNNKDVGKQLPLMTGRFSEDDYIDFIQEKRNLWLTHGYGPQAYLIDEKFAGWGGLQFENGDADFALILHPNFWGWGKRIFDITIDKAFNEMNLTSITVLFPPSRKNKKALLRFGFIEDETVHIKEQNFIRYRLYNTAFL